MLCPVGERNVLHYCYIRARKFFPDDERKARALAQWAATTASTNVHKIATLAYHSLPPELQQFASDIGQKTRIDLGDERARGAIVKNVAEALTESGVIFNKAYPSAMAVAQSEESIWKQIKNKRRIREKSCSCYRRSEAKKSRRFKWEQ